MLVMLDRKQVFRLQTWQTSALQPQYCQVDGGWWRICVLTHTFNRRSGYWLGIVTYGCFPNPTWFRIYKKYDITIVTLLLHVSALKRLWYNGPRLLVQQSAPFLCLFVSPASRGIIQPSLWIENGVLTSERTVWILPRCLNLNSAGIQSTERAVLMPRCHSDPTKASTESGVHCVVNAFNCYFQALLTFNIIYYIYIT